MDKEVKVRLVTTDDYIIQMLKNTQLSEEERVDCANQFTGFYNKVVKKAKLYNNTPLVEDENRSMHTAILGFIGGYASRHLYQYKKELDAQRGN